MGWTALIQVVSDTLDFQFRMVENGHDARIAELEAELARLRRSGEPNGLSFAWVGKVLDSVTDGFIALNGELRFAWLNAEAEHRFGVPRQQLLGRPISDRAEWRDNTLLQEQCRVALRNKVTVEFEQYRMHLQRWDLVKVYPTQEAGLVIYWKDITVRKRAQAEMQRAAAVLAQVHDSIITTDLEGKITGWNHGAEEIFGYRADEAMGQSVVFLYPEDERRTVQERILAPLIREGQAEIEMRNLRKSGETCWVRLSLSLLRDEDGTAYGMLGVATDITDRKRAEAALRESELRYRNLANAMPNIVYISSADGRTEFINRHWNQYSGVASEDCLEFAWSKWIHPEDWPTLLDRWMRSVATGESFELEYRVRRADGSYRWHLSRAVPIRDLNGVIVKWVGTLTDIDDRKRMEADLRKVNQRLKLQADILARTTDGVVAVNADNRATYCNEAAARMCGLPVEAIIGQPVSQVQRQNWLDPEDRPRAQAALAAGGTWAGESILIRNDGDQVFLSSVVSALPREEGAGYFAIVRDISERKRVEKELEQQAERLQRANEDLLHFAYAVSHDLQTPLRTVNSFSNLLARRYADGLDDEAREYLALIQDGSQRMSLMLRDLVRFAQVAGSPVNFATQIELEDAVARAIYNLRSTIEEFGAEIQTEALPSVCGDLGQLTQLFQNLIGNAVKYRKPGTKPRIKISAEKADKEWVVRVRDHGIGFDPKHAQTIFGVFERLHHDDSQGTGMGLTICKRIVERGGGRIWATGAPGEGAEFSFALPAERNGQPA